MRAALVLYRLSPDLVFSTGGFVALPVVISAKVLGIPIIIHEQTTHVGLANRLSSFFAQRICISFASSGRYFPVEKTILSGYPLREAFYAEVSPLVRFADVALPLNKKVLLILGGGNGSKLINDYLLKNWSTLVSQYFVILQTGKNFEKMFDFGASRSTDFFFCSR